MWDEEVKSNFDRLKMGPCTEKWTAPEWNHDCCTVLYCTGSIGSTLYTPVTTFASIYNTYRYILLFTLLYLVQLIKGDVTEVQQYNCTTSTRQCSAVFRMAYSRGLLLQDQVPCNVEFGHHAVWHLCTLGYWYWRRTGSISVVLAA